MNKEIEDIDRQIISLINKRSSKFIEELKNRKQITDIYSPAEKIEAIKFIESENNGPIPDNIFEEIFREIISYSQNLVQPVKVAYLGPEGTFSYLALRDIFGNSIEAVPQNTIASVFESVENGGASFGVVPVENSTEGSVSYTLDELMDTDLKILSEKLFRITNCLLTAGKELRKIKKIYSHPQPLAQCKNWLRTNLPDVEIIQVASTIMAVENASKDKLSAAIASEKAAKKYRMNILGRSIDDYKNNFTRFFIMGRADNPFTGHDKTSIVLGLNDSPGALYNILEPFRNAGINLSKIESRPNKKEIWAYNFFIDFVGHSSERNVRNVLDSLKKNVIFLKILGSYPVQSPDSQNINRTG